jgi:hypothetical protein
MTLIEIRPHRWGWEVFEAPGVQPVFPTKDQAINYARVFYCRSNAGPVGIFPAPEEFENLGP